MRSATKRKIGKDKLYLEWIHDRRCAVPGCQSHLYPAQTFSVIEAHHAGNHGFSQKADDRTALPLCRRHHRVGPTALHVLGRDFYRYHGMDRDYLIQHYNALYAAERSGMTYILNITKQETNPKWDAKSNRYGGFEEPQYIVNTALTVEVTEEQWKAIQRAVLEVI